MHTHPDYRRRGIGSTILKHLLEAAKASGVCAFEMHATADREPLYQQHGFALHPEPTDRKWLQERL